MKEEEYDEDYLIFSPGDEDLPTRSFKRSLCSCYFLEARLLEVWNKRLDFFPSTTVFLKFFNGVVSSLVVYFNFDFCYSVRFSLRIFLIFVIWVLLCIFNANLFGIYLIYLFDYSYGSSAPSSSKLLPILCSSCTIVSFIDYISSPTYGSIIDNISCKHSYHCS